MADNHPSGARTLERTARLNALDVASDTPWWRRLTTSTPRQFRLTQDHGWVADIQTVFERDDGFGWGVSCRRTTAFFEDARWTIRTHSPAGAPPTTRRPLLRSRAVWLRGERIIEVTDDGEQIAHAVHPVDGQPLTVITPDGTSLPLTRHTRHLLEAGPLTISRAGGAYVVSTTSPAPLEAALVCWHLMLGDYVRPLPIA